MSSFSFVQMQIDIVCHHVQYPVATYAWSGDACSRTMRSFKKVSAYSGNQRFLARSTRVWLTMAKMSSAFFSHLIFSTGLLTCTALAILPCAHVGPAISRWCTPFKRAEEVSLRNVVCCTRAESHYGFTEVMHDSRSNLMLPGSRLYVRSDQEAWW